MKRSRNWTVVGVAGLALGTMGCGEGPIASTGGVVSQSAPTGVVVVLVTNATNEDVEITVEFGTDLVALGLVEARSTERFDLIDGALMVGGLARIVVEPVDVAHSPWSDGLWVISGTTVEVTIVGDGILVAWRPSGPDDDCWTFDQACPEY